MTALLRRWVRALLIALVLSIGGYIMGHGAPDWWGSEESSTVHPLQDVGELAVRLGSSNLFDRRGNVVFIDSFQGGLARYRTAKLLSGDSVLVSAITARTGDYSCKLHSSQAADTYALVSRYQPYPRLSKHGIEVSFTIDDDAVSIMVYMTLYDGSELTYFWVRYVPASDKWQFLNSAGSWEDLVTGVALAADYQFFHTVKLVADFEADEYVYLISDSVETSMAGEGGRAIASPTNPCLEAGICLFGGEAATATIYVDDFIITQNER